MHLVLLSAQGQKQRFSKYGPGITSEGIPTVCGGGGGDACENADSWTSGKTYGIRTCGEGAEESAL